MSSDSKRSAQAQRIYDIFLQGGEQHSDLDPHYRCGSLGVRRPSHANALAAWEAGRDAAAIQPDAARAITKAQHPLTPLLMFADGYVPKQIVQKRGGGCRLLRPFWKGTWSCWCVRDYGPQEIELFEDGWRVKP